ncbi:protein RFT1 homolog [Phlebotomus argentipes]|uniref:protein RFT1 homolog n=1 Tax=Phlebotomus argentipes TaxID=94469 RepID=UPI002893458E|nr:protein RFT1 homolog [Phlebotomus argentipes]
MGRNILKSSLQNASFSIVFQILCRCVTFAINAYIVRSVGRDVLGVMNVRLLLLESTLLFLSREATSRAALSATSLQRSSCTWPQLINQMWLTVPICAFLCLPFLYIWLNLLSAVDPQLQDQYAFGCYAIAVSCVIEMCAEAPVFLGQVFCFVRLKVVLDTLHIFVRSVVFITIVSNNKSIAIYAFGTAQLSSALTIILGNYIFFYIYTKRLNDFRQKNEEEKKSLLEKMGSQFDHMEDFPLKSLTDLLPKIQPSGMKSLNADLQILILSFVKQGILKQILTEGEKYVMSVSPVLSFSEQATYDVVNNMGSLAARFIFRPIEDSSYFYFTQTIARNLKLKEQEPEKVSEASKVLANVCKVVLSIGLMGFVFGQSYSGTILLLYGGRDFVAGGLPELLLRWHSLAIILLAVNGISEGYMFATNTSKEIDGYNYYMAIFSVTFLLLSYQLTNLLGPVGFILANCANMIFRIGYSISFIHRQYRPVGDNPLRKIPPGPLFLSTLIACGVICKISEAKILPASMLYHLVIGAFCTVVSLGVWSYENRDLILLGFSKFRTKVKSQ